MKKVVRFFAMAAIAFGMSTMVACGDDDGGSGETGDPILLEESFDEGIPTTWTLIDADGDGYNWMVSTDLYSSPAGIDGTDCLMSFSYVNNVGPFTPDNYIISPTIHIPGAGGYNLSYYVANQQLEYADHYEVLIGTLENGNFTALGTLFSGYSTASLYDGDDFEHKTINLDEYKGKDVNIAFRHNDEDKFFLYVDQIKVSNEAAKGAAKAATRDFEAKK